MESTLITHTLEPVFDAGSKVLILGTMPSPKSREEGFYYGHPQNRFWPTLCGVLSEPVPPDIPGKQKLLLRRGIALWDVLARCEIEGAADSSIRNAVPNDFSRIFTLSEIRMVFTTGKTADRYFHSFCNRPSVCLPSSSPANRRVRQEELTAAYAAILEYLS